MAFKGFLLHISSHYNEQQKRTQLHKLVKRFQGGLTQSGEKRDNYVLACRCHLKRELKGPGHGMDKIITLCPLLGMPPAVF